MTMPVATSGGPSVRATIVTIWPVGHGGQQIVLLDDMDMMMVVCRRSVALHSTAMAMEVGKRPA